MLEDVLAAAPRAEAAALILADVALARALGWDHVLPLLANGLKTRDLRQQSDDLLLACHRAVRTASGQAVVLAADLARRLATATSEMPMSRATSTVGFSQMRAKSSSRDMSILSIRQTQALVPNRTFQVHTPCLRPAHRNAPPEADDDVGGDPWER